MIVKYVDRVDQAIEENIERDDTMDGQTRGSNMFCTSKEKWMK